MTGHDAVTVVVVNWNAGQRLRECVKSVLRHAPGVVPRLVVVDNLSTDGSADKLESVPGVTLVRAGENLGFGRACNLGARGVDSAYLLFLNPDAALDVGTLPSLLAFMDEPANARVGIFGVLLRDEERRVARSCSRFPTSGRLLARAVGLDRLFPSLGCAMSELAHDATRDVDQVIGAFFLVRRELFEALQGFDERFFVYYEEVDFSLRAHRAGWRSVYFAGAQAFHAGRGTTEQIKARRLFYYLRSRVLYSFKHFAWPAAFAVLLVTLLVEPVARSFAALGQRSWSGVRETGAAFALLWDWLPRWIIRGERA